MDSSFRNNKLLVAAIVLLLQSCTPAVESPSFNEWYSNLGPVKEGEYDGSKMRTKIITSETYHVDKVYRSMMGPTSENYYQLGDSGDVAWLVGYEVRVLNAVDSQEISPEFMCHNNLNLGVERNFPWKQGVFAYTNRIFTLTQGYTNLNLPDGFGIPFPSNQQYKTVFQALNHNQQLIDTSIYHEVTLKYFLDSEIDFPIKPLSQSTIWMVKQYEGPSGVYGEKPENEDQVKKKNPIYHPAQQPTCGVDMLANNPLAKLDLYYDLYGRKFTGHWKIGPGKEHLRFEATRMLNLTEDKMLYYASAHVHPYCDYLELFDITDSVSVFRTEMKSIPEKIGLEYITDFTSKEGILLSKDHRYELISSYNNFGEDTLSAMSVIYLYLNQ